MKTNKKLYADYSREQLIAELIKARQELSSNSVIASCLLEDAGIAMALWNEEGTLVTMNNLAIKYMGVSDSEILKGKTFHDLFPEENAQRHLQRFKDAINANLPQEYNDFVLTALGQRWFQSVYKAIFNEHNILVGVQVFARDITAQKNAELENRKRESQYSILFEHMAQGAFYQNADGSLEDCNQAALDIFGITEKQLSGRTSNSPEWKVIDKNGDDIPGDKHPSIVALKTGQPVAGFTAGIYNNKKQDFVWVNINAYPIFHEGESEPYQVFVTMHDISELKKSEQALRDSEEKLRNIIEHSTNLFYSHTTDGRLTYLSPQTREFLDCEPEEALSVWMDFVTDNPVNQQVYESSRKAIETGEAQPPYNAELIGKKGRKIWVEANEAPVVKDGKTVAVVGALMDITKRKMAQDELFKSEEKYRLLYNGIEALISIFDYDGICLLMNDRAAANFGGKPEDFIGKSFTELHGMASAEYIRRIREVIDSQAPKKYETLVPFPTGPRWLYSTVHPVRDSEGKIFAAQLISVDITDRKQAEEKLADSEEKYRYLIENSTQGILVAQDFRLKFVNRRMAAMLGYSQEEAISQPFESFIHPDDRSIAVDYHSKRLQSEEAPSNFQLRLFTKDNNIRWMDVHSVGIEWEGAPASLSFVSDITKEKLTAKELHDAQELIRALSDGSFEAVFLSEDGKFLGQNLQAQKMFGYTNEEIVSRMGPDIVIAGDRETVLNNMLSGHEQPYEATALRKDGSTFPVHIQARMMEYQGRIVRVTSLRDISRRKTVELALRKSEETYRKLVENAAEGILVTQGEKICFINSRVTKITGFTQADFDKMSGFELVHPDDREFAIDTHNRRMRGEDVAEVYTIRILTKSGDVRWVHIGGIKIEWEEQPASLLFLTDITGQKLLEEELANAEKLESLGVLAGGIAHDFNNILVAIMGNISLAKLSLAENEEVVSLLSDAEKATDRAKDLTQQLLTFAKGGHPIKMATDIEHIIRDAASLSLRGTKVICEMNIAENLYPVEVDEGQLNQVFNNLIINAAQAMKDGGKITVTAENIEIEVRGVLPLSAGRYLHIQVEDEGEGIPRENLKKIFDPFFTTKSGGTGLGLSSCYSIINRHNGLLTVNSDVGVGTTFHVYLPASAKQVLKSSEVTQSTLQGSGRVLVLDDDVNVLKVATAVLNRLGYQTDTAVEGDLAVNMVREAVQSNNRYNAIICDLTVPGGKGGKEIIADVLELDPDIVAIVSSGYANDFLKTDYESYGFSGFLSKPYKTEDVARIMHEKLQVPTKNRD